MAIHATVVCGNAGTGKSTWGKSLARASAAAVLDLDTVSGKLVIAAQRELGRSPDDRDSPDYKRVFREAIHATLFDIARECAGPVVLIAPFTAERSEADFPRWLEARLGCSVEVHYFVTNEDVRERRLRERGHPRDAAKFQDYAAYRARAPDESPPPYPHRWFDTTHGFPELPPPPAQAPTG